MKSAGSHHKAACCKSHELGQCYATPSVPGGILAVLPPLLLPTLPAIFLASCRRRLPHQHLLHWRLLLLLLWRRQRLVVLRLLSGRRRLLRDVLQQCDSGARRRACNGANGVALGDKPTRNRPTPVAVQSRSDRQLSHYQTHHVPKALLRGGRLPLVAVA